VTEPFSVETIREQLRRHPVVAMESNRRASVAVILGPKEGILHVLFIKRAEHPEDPWSGHMALPGGRREASDESDLQTAQRETLEEIGLDLVRDGELLGALDPLRATARGRPIDMIVVPFVFTVKSLTPIVPSAEVVSAHWVPLRPLLEGHWNTEFSVTRPDGNFTLPGWSVDGHVVWGLTYRMVSNLFLILSEASSRDACPT
jgi:8-oxo-dGTP pyrophosphatase MutT (NUDIX family)